MRDIVTSDRKKSLIEIDTAEDTLLHNSNMANLAAARRTIKEGLAYHAQEAARLTALDAEIVAFANDEANLQNSTEVSRLFKEVREKPARKSDRW